MVHACWCRGSTSTRNGDGDAHHHHHHHHDLSLTLSEHELIKVCSREHWKPCEDEKLRQLVEQNGPQNWNFIAGRLQGRSGKSCRLRWFNQLDPRINRTPFTATEEERLLEAQRALGNRWALIARLFPGRTDNAVKNHWHVVNARRQRQQPRTTTSGGKRRAGVAGFTTRRPAADGENKGGIFSVSSSSSSPPSWGLRFCRPSAASTASSSSDCRLGWCRSGYCDIEPAAGDGGGGGGGGGLSHIRNRNDVGAPDLSWTRGRDDSFVLGSSSAILSAEDDQRAARSRVDESSKDIAFIDFLGVGRITS